MNVEDDVPAAIRIYREDKFIGWIRSMNVYVGGASTIQVQLVDDQAVEDIIDALKGVT